MSRCPSVRSALAAGLLVAGCGVLPPEVCTDELGYRVDPTEASLHVGESVTADVEAFTCGGRKAVPVDMRWTSEDPSVATVDATTGRITAQAAGTTTIVGEDVGEYSIGPVSVAVTVAP